MPISPSRSFLFTMLLILFAAALTATAQEADIPTPESALGFRLGADFKLANYDESLAYFRRLEQSSDHLKLVEAGRTSEGRPWYFALISSPENLANIERCREIVQRLAHPEGLRDEEARQLAREGKAIVHIDGGLHATEVATAQHTIQLAHDLLARRQDPGVRNIFENVILLLWPSVNPDGQNIVVSWYRSNLGTPYEVAPLVELYQKYVGHDNNRDAYMLNMIESRVLARIWKHWEPHIVYVHHQSSPFPTRIWLPPFAEPIASQAPPLMSRTVNTIGMAIAQALESKGQVGATHMGTGFDAWYPGYVDYLPMLQNAAAFWTETALYRYATPHFYTIDDFPSRRRDLRPETLYSSPWPGGWWRLRDAVDYMLTASFAVLDYAAKYKEDLLYNRYQTGRNTIRKYETEPPYAYFIPQAQRDPVAAVELLRRLAFNGIRILQLTRPLTVDGVRHPEGTWVIPMNQEFAELVRQLLDQQSYPDLREYPEGPLEQPYDAAGWTLPYQMDVRVIELTSPMTTELRAASSPVRGAAVEWSTDAQADSSSTLAEADASSFDSVPGKGFDTHPVAAAIRPPAGRTRGEGPNLVVDPAQNNSFRAVNRALRAGKKVRFESAEVGVAESPPSSARFVIEGISRAEQDQWVEELALVAERSSASGGPAVAARIALYRPWRASMDEGWTRWVLEQYGFQFMTIRNSDFHNDHLTDRFDVIVLPSDRPTTLLKGYEKGQVPPRYQGGLEDRGVRALDRFVRSGGTLVCLNQSSDFAIEELHLPVKNVVAALERKDFFTGGSIFEVAVNPDHPIMAGMPERAKIFVNRSPVFTTLNGFGGVALAKYEKYGSPLLSGYLMGEEHLQGFAAALDVRHGKGHVILIGFRPQWRGQPFGTFRVLFNAVLYAGEQAAAAKDNWDFWSPPAGTEPPEKNEAKKR